MRHNVGAENGNGATALSGFFGLRTSCDSRSHALSGRESNTDCVAVLVVATGASAVGFVGALLTVVVGLVLKLKPRVMFPSFMKLTGVTVAIQPPFVTEFGLTITEFGFDLRLAPICG
jgi:hypothetical protein